MRVPNDDPFMLARMLYEAVHGIVVLNFTHRLGGTHEDARERVRLLLGTFEIWR